MDELYAYLREVNYLEAERDCIMRIELEEARIEDVYPLREAA